MLRQIKLQFTRFILLVAIALAMVTQNISVAGTASGVWGMTQQQYQMLMESIRRAVEQAMQEQAARDAISQNVESTTSGADSTNIKSKNITSTRTVYPTTVDLNNCGWYDSPTPRYISATLNPDGPRGCGETWTCVPDWLGGGCTYWGNLNCAGYAETWGEPVAEGQVTELYTGINATSPASNICPSDRQIMVAHKQYYEVYKSVSGVTASNITWGDFTTYGIQSMKVYISAYCCPLKN